MENNLIDIIITKNKIVTELNYSIIKKAIERSGNIARFIEKVEDVNNKNCVVCGTILDAIKLKIAGVRKIVIWIQGIIPEESLMRNNSRIRYTILNIMEYYAIKISENIIVVSLEMKKYYEKKYKLKIENKVYLMPCFNTKMQNYKENNRYKENNFVYAGNMQKWQCFDEIARIYKNIETKENVGKLYIFTFDKEKAKEIIFKYKIKNYLIDTLDKDKLNLALQNIKYGFIIRNNIAVNNVSTPTKISTYLANGVIPIYSECIKDFNQIAKKYDIGIAIKNTSNGEEIARNLTRKIDDKKLREKISSIFEEYYNEDIYIAQISKLFRKM